MCPAFGIRSRAGELAHFGEIGIVPDPEKLRVMTGPDFVHRHIAEQREVVAFEILVLLFFRPRRIRQSDVVVSLGRFRFVRSGSVHRSKRGGAFERRRLDNFRLRAAGHRNDFLVDQKLSQSIKLLLRR